MPKGSKVARCVDDVMDDGKSKVPAIKICQASTGDSYRTGERSKKENTMSDIDKNRMDELAPLIGAALRGLAGGAMRGLGGKALARKAVGSALAGGAKAAAGSLGNTAVQAGTQLIKGKSKGPTSYTGDETNEDSPTASLQMAKFRRQTANKPKEGLGGTKVMFGQAKKTNVRGGARTQETHSIYNRISIY